MNIHAIYAFYRNQLKLSVTVILWEKGAMSVVWRFQPEIQKNQTNLGLTSGKFVTLLKHETLMTFFTCIELLSPRDVNY